MNNFLSRLIKGVPDRANHPDAQLDEIASLDSKPFFGGGSTNRKISQSLHSVDIRTLWRDGYSDKQIRGLMSGENTILELSEKEPLGNKKSATAGRYFHGRRLVTADASLEVMW